MLPGPHTCLAYSLRGRMIPLPMSPGDPGDPGRAARKGAESSRKPAERLLPAWVRQGPGPGGRVREADKSLYLKKKLCRALNSHFPSDSLRKT